MSDDLNRLQAALKAAPPASDPARKHADAQAAMLAFDKIHEAGTQESAGPARHTSVSALYRRMINGGKKMIDRMTTRAGLAMTAALVTAGVALVLVVPHDVSLSPEISPASIPDARGLENLTDSDVVAALPLPSEAEDDFSMAETRAQTSAAKSRGMVTGLVAGGASNDSLPRMEEPAPGWRPAPEDHENFTRFDENPVLQVTDAPVSTFSIDVDTASYAIVRSSLSAGRLPPRDAVRVEELVNYFPYDYAAPEPGGLPFQPAVSVAPAPWNPDKKLVHIALQGAGPEIAGRPPLNLVFLIDTSGSMQDANKLPLLKQSLGLMLGQLRPEDQVAIVTYAGSAGQVLAPTPAGERATILGALDRLEAGGSTAGQAGLDQAYAVAAQMADEGEVTRVLLATDGDFNVGPSDPDALKGYIKRQREGGAFLSVLGFGRGNLNDALMQALAQNGNGQAAYIDTLAEAQKVLVDQLTGALFPIAQDVKVQVEFNPAQAAEYRLIGYETRALRREDFNNDAVDAGEIGAGHQVTAIYEVTPPGSPALLNDPLRYQPATATGTDEASELGLLRLRWKTPGANESELIELPIPADGAQPGQEARFATAIAGFGQLLRGSDYLGGWSYADAIELANGARGEDDFGYRAEAVQLMRLAQSLSATPE